MSARNKEQMLLRVPPDVKKRLEELSEERGISLNALVLTILDEWLKRYGEPRFKHFNIYEDHVTVFDSTLGRLVDVYKRDKKLICGFDGTNKCDHVRFCYTLPAIIKLVEEGWLEKG